VGSVFDECVDGHWVLFCNSNRFAIGQSVLLNRIESKDLLPARFLPTSDSGPPASAGEPSLRMTNPYATTSVSSPFCQLQGQSSSVCRASSTRRTSCGLRPTDRSVT